MRGFDFGMNKLIDPDEIREKITDDAYRYRFQMLVVNAILAVVAMGMTVLNIFTHKQSLMISTLAFSLVCVANVIACVRFHTSEKLMELLFVFSFFALFTFFIISGTPEGFSVLWICLLPSCGLLLFGRRRGTVLCLFMLAEILFFFDTIFGRSLLKYDYNESFCTRFPLLFIAFFCVAYFLETVRMLTQRELQRTRAEFQYLSSHDALTGKLNRYGFNEAAAACHSGTGSWQGAAFFLLDIDRFKLINDSRGHIAGDEVLAKVSGCLNDLLPNASVSRWGGDEFAVLLPCTDSAQEVRALAEDVRARVAALTAQDGTPLGVSVSIGAVRVRREADLSMTDLVREADIRLYDAKEHGRDRISFCEL